METKHELLERGLRDLGIHPDNTIIIHFKRYLQELRKWNRAYNLTALREEEEIITKHFFDSLLYLRLIPKGKWQICDIGSGAGFPGIPIAIVRPEVVVCLIEPSRKKAAFLRHIKRTLSLTNIEIMQLNVENFSGDPFDIAVTRALFGIKELIKKAGRVLRKDGFFIVSKGPRFEEEIRCVPANVKIVPCVASLPGTSLTRNLLKVTFQG